MTSSFDSQRWQRIGAWAGGAVFALACSPNFAADGVALAATAAGIFRSTDGGASWQLSNHGLADPSVLAVAFAPQAAPGIALAFAATEGGRMYQSADLGATWQEVPAWAGLGQATALAFSPNFAHDHTFFAATAEGVLRTQDRGVSWESSTFGLHDLEILCIACAPDFATSEVLWVGTMNGGFYRSRNGARSWRDAGAGLPDDAITCLLVSPAFAEDQTLYAGSELNGLYRSTNAGGAWEQLALQPAGVFALVALGNRLHLGADSGLYWSDDGGENWLAAAGGEITVTALAVADPQTALAGALDGLVRTDDGGRSWQPSATGLAAHAPPVVERAPNGDLIALDHLGSGAISVDNGIAWQLWTGAADAPPVTAIGLAADWSIFHWWAATANGGLYRVSRAGAETIWQPLLDAVQPGQVFQQIIALPGPNQESLLLAGIDDRLYVWNNADGFQALVESVPWSGATILRSQCSPNYGVDQGLIVVTAQANARGNYDIQLWRTNIGEQEWDNFAQLETEIPSVALLWPNDPAERSLFVATRNRVIRIFTAAASQELASSQSFLAEDANITALAAPTFHEDRRLWAATNRGVFASADGGVTWQPVGDELAERPLVALFPMLEAGALLAIELGGAVWRSEA